MALPVCILLYKMLHFILYWRVRFSVCILLPRMGIGGNLQNMGCITSSPSDDTEEFSCLIESFRILFPRLIPVKDGEPFLQITCGQDWFLVQKLNSFSSFFKRQLGSRCQEGVELRGTLSVACKWDISWRGSFQGGLSVGGVKILGCYWNLDWRWREGTRRGMLGGVRSLLLQGKGTQHLLLYSSHLEPMFLPPQGIFGSSLVVFPFSIKAASPEGCLGFWCLSSPREWDETRQTWF